MVKKKKSKTTTKATTTRIDQGGGAGRISATGKYTETLHPRDASGHWITTGGGVRRIKEGSHEKRHKLAQQIKKARKKAGSKANHNGLREKVRKMRNQRRSRGSNPQGTNRRAGPHGHQPAHPDALNVARKRVADNVERSIAQTTGGKQDRDNKPYDVLTPGKAGAGDHAIEVKSKSFGSKAELSVHPNALALKAADAKATKGRTYHTVLVDIRDRSEGGTQAAGYSGHDVYYKRGAGAYGVASMYKVKDAAELNRLIHATDKQLPAAARGSLPKGQALKELKEKAIKDKAYNDARGKERKKRLGSAAYKRGGQTGVDQPEA
jgi:hypothetical protein